MTWLDIGNGWRNLYLLSCLMQACALGTLFAARHWFSKKSRAACFLTGVAATPFAQYLWTLLLALMWPQAPKLVYIGALPALACLCLLIIFLRRLKKLKALLVRGWRFARRVCRFDKPALIALCFALCMLILLLPACVRFCSSMACVSGGDAGEYMGLALRYCEDRDLGELLEKNDLTGHFRGHSHFPSLELYMSYGLFHTGEALGYPYDKPVFTGLGLMCFYMLAGYFALLLIFCRERKVWILLGALLFNLVPNLYDSVALAPRDIWRIAALFLAMLVFAGLEPRGSWRRYTGKLVLSFAVCFCVMSAHVVCFVVLPFIVAAWVIWRWLDALLKRKGDAGRTLLASLGIALAGAGGTIVAFLGNLWCYQKWGEMSPWRLMTTYTDAPWYPLYMQMEYKLEATSTHVNFWSARNDILLGYATPIGVWGAGIALVTLVCALIYLIVKRAGTRRLVRQLTDQMPLDGPSAIFVREPQAQTELPSTLMLCALLTLCTLAPMTGLLDSGFYCFSGAFLKLPRYTLQWFLLAAIMICAFLSTLSELWPCWLDALANRSPRREKPLFGRFSARTLADAAFTRRLPAALCALLCGLAFVQGTKQTGYADSFYRYSRGVMENEQILLDNGYRDQYALLTRLADRLEPEQKILITRVGYQYALRGRGYVLSANPIVPLLNLKLEEIEPALKAMNAAMLATEPDFWDDRYFALSTLSEYLSALPPEQIIQTDRMRIYLLDPALTEPAAQEWEE